MFVSGKGHSEETGQASRVGQKCKYDTDVCVGQRCKYEQICHRFIHIMPVGHAYCKQYETTTNGCAMPAMKQNGLDK